MPVAFLNVAADTPESAQGDTEARPSPAPRAKRANDTAAATMAPAAMLAHEMAETESVKADASVRTRLSTGRLRHLQCTRCGGKCRPLLKFPVARTLSKKMPPACSAGAR